jgi:hypothetical protein
VVIRTGRQEKEAHMSHASGSIATSEQNTSEWATWVATISDRRLLSLALEQSHKLTAEENEALRKELRDRIKNDRHQS